MTPSFWKRVSVVWTGVTLIVGALRVFLWPWLWDLLLVLMAAAVPLVVVWILADDLEKVYHHLSSIGTNEGRLR